MRRSPIATIIMAFGLLYMVSVEYIASHTGSSDNIVQNFLDKSHRRFLIHAITFPVIFTVCLFLYYIKGGYEILLYAIAFFVVSLIYNILYFESRANPYRKIKVLGAKIDKKQVLELVKKECEQDKILYFKSMGDYNNFFVLTKDFIVATNYYGMTIVFLKTILWAYVKKEKGYGRPSIIFRRFNSRRVYRVYMYTQKYSQGFASDTVIEFTDKSNADALMDYFAENFDFHIGENKRLKEAAKKDYNLFQKECAALKRNSGVAVGKMQL